jgi:hypothetical protein
MAEWTPMRNLYQRAKDLRDNRTLPWDTRFERLMAAIEEVETAEREAMGDKREAKMAVEQAQVSGEVVLSPPAEARVLALRQATEVLTFKGVFGATSRPSVGELVVTAEWILTGERVPDLPVSVTLETREEPLDDALVDES